MASSLPSPQAARPIAATTATGATHRSARLPRLDISCPPATRRSDDAAAHGRVPLRLTQHVCGLCHGACHAADRPGLALASPELTRFQPLLRPYDGRRPVKDRSRREACHDVNVISWNLKGSKGVDVRAVVDHLGAMAPDVVVLQEVQAGQARAIARSLGAKTRHWGF